MTRQEEADAMLAEHQAGRVYRAPASDRPAPGEPGYDAYCAPCQHFSRTPSSRCVSCFLASGGYNPTGVSYPDFEPRKEDA